MTKGNLPQLYAPRTIDDVIGHPTVIADIKKRAAEKRWPSVFFLTGPTGTGKTTLTRFLEKYLTCVNPAKDGTPCDKCEYCQDINEASFTLAVREFNASNIGIEEMRKIEASTKKRSITSNTVVYFIDELQELAGAGGSPKALKNILTMLERDIPGVFFILGAMEEIKLPHAVKDRTATYKLKPIGFEDIAKRLKYLCEKHEKVKIDTQEKIDAIVGIAQHCRGSMRAALKMLERCLFGNLWNEQLILEEFGAVSDKSLRQWIHEYLKGDVSIFEQSLPVEFLEEVIKFLELLYKQSRGVQLMHWEESKVGTVGQGVQSATLSGILTRLYQAMSRPYLTPTVVTMELLRAQELVPQQSTTPRTRQPKV